MHHVAIALNPHWYSTFWIKQFYQLWRQRKIGLRPLLTKRNPPTCFYFEVNGKPCLIDVSDHKDLYTDPKKYYKYFKANFSPQKHYPPNVLPSINGTTIKKANVPPLVSSVKEYDLVWLTGISGGRLHKMAMFEAIASLPLKMKLAAKMVTPQDTKEWGHKLAELGVEVWQNNMPYIEWLEWNKKGRWCLLSRGKHDCLSFKMIDYCSIKAAVVADYVPTTTWPVPLQEDTHFISFGFSGPTGNELSPSAFAELREEYRQKAWAALPKLQNLQLQEKIANNNLEYFATHIQDGQAAYDVLQAAVGPTI